MPASFPSSLDPLQTGDPSRVGPYRLVGRLGAGGMGSVYGAVDPENRCLAVKLVHREFAENEEFRARFAREVRLVEQVQARCAPAFAGADPEADTPWLATEYVPGPTLRQHVHAAGPLADGMLLAFAAGLAEALDAIHAAGVVHRDLKPSNVILAPDGPKVLDFGIARALDGTGLTRTGGLMGSPGWIAPERYHGTEASPAADIFAWGGLVAFAATGRAPFGTGTPQVVAARTIHETPDTSGVPSTLRTLVERGLDREPSIRPTAKDVLHFLEAEAVRSDSDTTPVETFAKTLIDSEWTQAPEVNHNPEDWVSHARRRSRILKPALGGVAALSTLVALATGVSLLNSDLLKIASLEPIAPGTEEDQLGTTDADTNENSSRNPGIMERSVNGERAISVEMTAVTVTPNEVQFEGTANYLANSGSMEFGTTFYTPHDYELSHDPSLNIESQVWSTPGEIFGVLSPEHPEIEFSVVIPQENAPDPGVIFYSNDGAEQDPHLCYRSEPYAETGTQFLHNAGDSWQDCAEDLYE